MRRLEVPYDGTEENVTLVPFALPVSPGRMIAWLELFIEFASCNQGLHLATEGADDCRHLHLGIRCAGLLEFDRSSERFPVAPAQ
jgi:hypothetical protein